MRYFNMNRLMLKIYFIIWTLFHISTSLLGQYIESISERTMFSIYPSIEEQSNSYSFKIFPKFDSSQVALPSNDSTVFMFDTEDFVFSLRNSSLEYKDNPDGEFDAGKLNFMLQNLSGAALKDISFLIQFKNEVIPQHYLIEIPIFSDRALFIEEIDFFTQKDLNLNEFKFSIELISGEVRPIFEAIKADSILYLYNSPTLPIDRGDVDQALIFAVNEYQRMNNLKNPIDDANVLRSILTEKYGFQVEVVENPTFVDIREKLSEYSKKYNKEKLASEGQLLIFFSGHGLIDQIDGNGYFLTSDSEPEDLYPKAVQFNELKLAINSINCRHILVCIDACYSGSFAINEPMRGLEKERIWKRPNELSDQEKFYQKHLERITRKYLTSGALKKTPDDSKLVKAFVEGLKIEWEKNQFFTIGKIFETYLNRVNPTPKFGTFGSNDLESTFIFFPRYMSGKE